MQKGQMEPVAIVGIGCRFPGASSPQEFWKLLSEGRDAIREVPNDRWHTEALYHSDPLHPGKMMSRWGGFLDQIDQFDWHAFRILPREVKQMDPQHRLLLEVAWEALEDAGIPFSQIAGSRASVTIGIGWSDYLRLQTRNWSQIDGYTATGNANSFAANRLSYIFNLTGPSVSLDAGCTSSLSALYFACQSLWLGQSHLALAGGVNLMLSPDSTIMVSKAGLLSPDGRCKTLDAHADGFVRGEGAAVVILKRLSDVLPSDRVYALIQGVSQNHNGHNEWIIASSSEAQESLLQDVYHQAHIDPAEVDYVELHGTGFLRGDAIEAKALGTVLGSGSLRTRPCFVGSVKTNIGHLEAAAGVASVIKVALSLYHKKIPPTLHVQDVNPEIPLQDLHLTIPQTTYPWPDKEGPALAGVTALAFTGANAHAILSAPPPLMQDQERTSGQVRLLPLSARSKDALYAQAVAFRNYLQAEETRVIPWRDICYTASMRRTHHEHRLAITARTPLEAALALDDFIQTPDIKNHSRQHKLAFLFAHKNPQWSTAEIRLLMNEPVFRSTIETCDLALYELTKRSLLDVFIQATETPSSIYTVMRDDPVTLFMLQIALATLWRSWDIEPAALLGEGLGEIAAAYVEGALSLEDALRIIIQNTDSGSVPEVHLSKEAIPLYSIENTTSAPARWQRQSSKSILSVATVDHFVTDGYDIFIELGSFSALSGAFLARLHHNNVQGHTFSSLGGEEKGREVLLQSVGTLYSLGYPVNWSALAVEEGQCVSLPTYCWQRERLWPDWLTVDRISTPPEELDAVFASHDALKQAPNQSQEKNESSASIVETLNEIWRQVLGLDQIETQSNFFELGGHSLLATQLLMRIHNAFQIDISLSDLFQAPTPVACLSLLLQKKATQMHSEQLDLPTISPNLNHYDDPFPITDVQQAYWVGRSVGLELGNVGNHGYAEVEAYGLDLKRFTLCLRQLIERHEMLRAVIRPDGQQQILTCVPPFQLRMVDLSDLEPAIQAISLAQIRQGLDHQMLPVDRWPAFTILVSRLTQQHVRLHVGIESLFIDAWSMNILIQELAQLYQNPTATLPSLNLSFRDYVLTTSQLQNTEAYRRSQAYWTQRIPTLPAAPELPLACAPETVQQPHFVHREASLTVQQWQRLKARAAKAGLTPSGILLAAFAEILARWSKTACFSINLSLFNRLPLHPQVNEIVGDFTSLVVLAVDNTVSDTFEKRAQHLQAQLWHDLDHSYYSGVKVLSELARTQDGIGKAIMPIVFTSLLIQDAANRYPTPWQETVYCISQTPQVWLDHQVLEVAERLVFHWQAVDELFPAGLLDTMFATYCRFLTALAMEETPWQQVSPPLLPAEALHQRVLANSTATPLSSELLHTLFLKQAATTPEQVAVIAPGRNLSYTQLATRSLVLAWHIREAGARPNQLVAIVMEKGWEQVVAVLGILQAGAAYLPIDPNLPQERLTYLLQHGEVRLVLTQSRVLRQLPWLTSMQPIIVDELEEQQEGLSELAVVQKPEDLAYVIYTSGSTGLPKGVMVDHRGAVNTILDINERFGIGPADRVLALSALNFDLSVYDIFGLLAAGGTIVLPVEDSLRNPTSWLNLLVKERITLWNTVPALLQMLVEYGEAHGSLETCELRLALLSGDWIPLTLPERLKQYMKGVKVISLGGATEASIWSIFHPIEEIEPTWKSIPYGKPLRNQKFEVLNERLEPCPVWVPGQLYIGGVGLARGYWRDEEKTLRSFFLHPRTGERLYRTGDLGRYLPDGTIEFLGREDFQVKVQGHRIELGEIEETLLQHPNVNAAIATAITESAGSKRLIAYVVLQNEHNTHANGSTPVPLVQNTGTSHTFQQLTQNNASQDKAYDKLQRLEAHFGQTTVRQEPGKLAIELTDATPHSNLVKRYRERLSYRKFQQGLISFEDFSNFLHVLRQIELEGLPKYLYPSAGGIYPVQIYLSVKPDRIEKIQEGIYYYDPRLHQLVLLSENEHLTRNLHAKINQPIFDESAFSLFLIGQGSQITSQYGAAARDFSMLEAGYMSQLLMTRAAECQLGLCPIGAMDFEPIRGMFALEESHILLHSLLGGKVDPTVATGWSFLSEDPDTSSSALQSLQSTVTPNALRQFLHEKLPEYMVPAAIMILETLPLTPNGKVDRKNLPAPTAFTTRSVEISRGPQSEMEQVIANIWQEVLAIEKIGVYDNFFDVGGNSLLMVRAYSKLRNVLNQELSLVDTFFQYPNIHSLATFLTQQTQSSVTGEEEHSRQSRSSMEARKEIMQQQKQARLRHRTIERSSKDG